MAALRQAALGRSGRLPPISVADALLEERRELTFATKSPDLPRQA